MNLTSEQLLTKTPQGVNATRSGVGLSPKAYTMLKLFDGTMPVAGFRKTCRDASLPDADFQSTLQELLQFDHLRLVDKTAADTGPAQDASAGERRMMLTLDFTMADAPASPVAAAQAVASPAKAPTPAPAAPAPAPTAERADDTARDGARDDKALRLKRESEVRQKLVVALQPRIEEELRARLRPKLEQELRPKLIAALRPGLEAEVRTALTKELTPRIELELKARFAKTMAAQKAADQPAAKVEPAPVAAAAVAPVAGPADSAHERLLASMSMPLFSVDKTGVCSYMSPAWAQFSGFTTQDVIGKHLTDFFADHNRKAMTTLLTGIANGTALRFEQQAELLRKAGDPLWVEIAAAPLTAANGESMGVCGTLRDATALRRTEDQAEADGVRLLLLVDQIDTGVILEDGEGNIQQANPALCTLLSLDAAPYSLEGMPVTELFERAAAGFIGPEGFLRRVAEVRAAGEDAKGESLVMADGRVVQQDYLAVTVGASIVGRLWLFREMLRPQARIVS